MSREWGAKGGGGQPNVYQITSTSVKTVKHSHNLPSKLVNLSYSILRSIRGQRVIPLGLFRFSCQPCWEWPAFRVALNHSMEQRKPPQYILEVFADPTCVKDIVRGMFIPIFRIPRSLIPARNTAYHLLSPILSFHKAIQHRSP